MTRQLNYKMALVVVCAFIFSLSLNSKPCAQDSSILRKVRTIENDDDFALLGFRHLVPSVEGSTLLRPGQPARAAAPGFFAPVGARTGGFKDSSLEVSDPINRAFGRHDDGSCCVVSFGDTAYGVQDPRGMTMDSTSGRLFILDTRRIIRVESQSGQHCACAISPRESLISQLDLPAGLGELRGLAFHPANGHLYLLNPTEGYLYELGERGQVLSIREFAVPDRRKPTAVVFAPSGDLTDDPLVTNLFIADATGAVTEWSLEEAMRFALVTTVEASLVQTVDTSQFFPPSPDPAGIAYIESSDSLLVSDSEVNEMPIFTGDNLFDMSRAGTLSGTATTLSFSDEPTGVAADAAGGHLFFSDDTGPRTIYDVDLGPDGVYGTQDDVVTWLRTNDFGANDPEGLAFGQGDLFLADGSNAEIYKISPGVNGVLDGVPPDGDDQVTSFDMAIFGFTDIEGITFDTHNGHLYTVGKPSDFVAHVTTDGTLVRMVDISLVDASKPAGLAYGPSSLDPAVMSLYITDRGVDNNSDPDENDGKIYEVSIPPLSAPGNTPPTVSAGPDQTVTLPDGATLDGTVSDDGLPGPPEQLTSTWSQTAGPGRVTFADPGAVDTTASFSTAGTYELRLLADDGDLVNSDEITIIVQGSNGETVTEIPVSTSTDDAEELVDGNMVLAHRKLELVDSNGSQQVGLRFNGVGIHPGATLLHAYVQFQALEVNSEATSLFVEGEGVDNAATFLNVDQDISSRPRTAAAVSWSPAAWTTEGEAGIKQRTPDIAPIIQELVDRAGWQTFNSLVIVVTGTGKRVAASFDESPGAAPLLHLEYLVTDTPPEVMINDPADGAEFDAEVDITFMGTASDAEDGDVTANLAWVSDLDGALGTGGSFSRSDLSVGVHTITATVTDSAALDGSDDIIVTIHDANSPPTEITLDNMSVEENQPDDTLVGNLQATDTDGDDVHVFALVEGEGSADNALFTITGHELRTVGPLDYEVSDALSIRVQADDQQGGTFEKALLVAVTNQNEPPTDIALDKTTVEENQPDDTLVGLLQADDPEVDDLHLFTLVAGEGAGVGSTNNGSFRITGNELRTAALMDYEVSETMSVRVRADDQQGGALEKVFAITIMNLNESPSDMTLDNATIDEKQPADTLVGNLQATDPDVGDTHVFALVAGEDSTDNGSFKITGNQLLTVEPLDFDLSDTLSVRVEANDQQGGTLEMVFPITVMEVITSHVRGDANGDGTVDLSDAIHSWGYLFTGSAELLCLKAADANDDGELDISDGLRTLGYLFQGEGPLSEPFPTCGFDPTADDLTCESYPPCEG